MGPSNKSKVKAKFPDTFKKLNFMSEIFGGDFLILDLWCRIH
jgi:hypothetical protein